MRGSIDIFIRLWLFFNVAARGEKGTTGFSYSALIKLA